MTATLFQVVFRAPSRYSGLPKEIKLLRAAVEEFIAKTCGEGSGVVGATIGELTGLVVFYCKSAADAYALPRQFSRLEQYCEPVEIDFNRIQTDSPRYRAVA